MQACRLVDSKMVISCKSSNDVEGGNEGYIDVSAEVMLIEVISARKKISDTFTCLKKPTHLLYDFYSIDKVVVPYGLRFEENEILTKENLKFRVKFPRVAKCGRSRSGMSSGSGMKKAEFAKKDPTGRYIRVCHRFLFLILHEIMHRYLCLDIVT